MDVSLFDFDLPERCIALRPARPRDSAKLLVVEAGRFKDLGVSDLPLQLREGDLLVLNETKVLPAALKATRPARPHGGGGDVSGTINLHKRESSDIWRAFVKPAKRLKDGDTLIFQSGLTAIVSDKQDGGDVGLEFSASGEALDNAIAQIGSPPLPPYIARQRPPDEADKQDYQTVYAAETGSVAAPTAGLHFTPGLLRALKDKGVQIETLTLHVGAGTFLPIKTDDTDNHHMHSEWFEIAPKTAEAINRAKADGRRVIAVGTTSLRALESASDDHGRVTADARQTDIFITPGYRFKVIDAVMTNFHLPKSTLFMLVSAVAGRACMQSAYAHAIDSGYRFYSYGDSSLLWVNHD